MLYCNFEGGDPDGLINPHAPNISESYVNNVTNSEGGITYEKKHYEIYFAFLLFSIIINCMSFGVGAETEVGSDETMKSQSQYIEAVQIQSQSVEVQSDAPSIIAELPDLRDEYEKHFLMSDGSYTVATYNEPVHKMVDDNWIEVDNTLKLSTGTDGVSRYETVNGIANVSFAKEFQNHLVTMEQDGYSISWGLTALSSSGDKLTATTQPLAPPVTATVVPLDLDEISLEERKTMALKSTSTIRYANALDRDVDLDYVVLPSRVKESITLNGPKDISAYIVDIIAQNISARLLDNREIEFFNEDGEVVFSMWSQYMYDAAGELSEDIAVKMVSKGTGRYLVSIIPDQEWLSDPDRVYPVVIDPDVSVSGAPTNMIDTFTWAMHPVQNPNLDKMYIGRRSSYGTRAYFRYQIMPTLPDDAVISYARQRLTITSGTSTANPLDAYTVNVPWSVDTITWDNQPSMSNLTCCWSNIEHNDLSYFSFPITGAVQLWYDGSTIGQNNNYGIMLCYSNENINDYNAVYSSDYPDESKHPSLTITYTSQQHSLTWPVPGYQNVTSEWGFRDLTSYKIHRGIDIRCPEGTTVVASVPGTVWQNEYDDKLGWYMDLIRFDNTFRVRYCHLSGYIKESNTYVTAGSPIARSGNTGRSYGAHLHFQLQWGTDTAKLFNPLEVYHEDDLRNELGYTNPNPMFLYVDGEYIPNYEFDYTYVLSDYNSVDESWKRPGI